MRTLSLQRIVLQFRVCLHPVNWHTLDSLNTRRALSGKGLESDTLSISDPSSRSVITPPTGINPEHFGRRLRDRDVELTDLRVTWPSRVRTQDSNSISGIGVGSELHRTIQSRKDDDSDVNIVIPVGVDIEAQEGDHVSLGLALTCFECVKIDSSSRISKGYHGQ